MQPFTGSIQEYEVSATIYFLNVDRRSISFWGNSSYIYKNGDYFQKKKLLDFFNHLSYLGDVVPSSEVNKILLKHRIDVSLFVGALSHEDRRTVYGKFETSSIHLLLAYPLFRYIFG